MIAGAEAARRLEDWLHAVPLRLRVLAEVRASGVPAFIVGGTLRDALLGRESHDLDLAVAGDAISLARRVADAVGVAIVPLDREHDVARAVARGAAGEEHFDCAGLRGADIEADLRARDFTVNAMGVAAAGPWERLLDPTGGRADLAAGVLRAAYDDAFRDDPLRVLRGVRLCGALDLQVDPHTETLMGAAASQLSRVSPERIRDELLQIVALPAAGELWRYSAGLGALAVALPPLGETDLVARSAERLDALVALEAGLAEGEPGALAPYGRRLAVDLGQVLPGGFSRGAVVRLAAACSALPGGHEAAQAVARQLRLSSAAARQVAQTVRGAEAILARPGGRWDARAVYRYYRETGEGGVAGVLLALACQRASGVAGSDETAAALWRAWYDERDERVDPPALLSGCDLMNHWGLAPGPEIGTLLADLREAQAVGEVETRAQALAWIEARRRDLAGGPAATDEAAAP